MIHVSFIAVSFQCDTHKASQPAMLTAYTLFGVPFVYAVHAENTCKHLLASVGVVQSTYGIASAARSAVLISRHAKAAAAHTAAVEEAEPSA